MKMIENKTLINTTIQTLAKQIKAPYLSLLVVSANVPYRFRQGLLNIALTQLADRCLSTLAEFFSTHNYQTRSVNTDKQLPLYGIYFTNVDPLILKQQMVRIESQGFRLMDLDVYHQQSVITRRLLSLPARSCFVCHYSAVHCIFHERHSETELLASIEQQLSLSP